MIATTVKDLKNLLATRDDSDEVRYFDSEAGEDVDMITSFISFVTGVKDNESSKY